MLFPPRETCLEGMTEDLRIPKSREPITYDRTPDTVTTAVRGSGYSGRMIPAVRLQNPPSSGRLAKTGERHMRVSIRIHRCSLSRASAPIRHRGLSTKISGCFTRAGQMQLFNTGAPSQTVMYQPTHRR